jgi:putative glutamine amidotransferase
MERPRIGITTSYQDGTQSLDHHYVTAVQTAGGVPVVLPTLSDEAAVRSLADVLDGLIITGGPGITRGLVGKLPDDLPPVDPLRDQSDCLWYNAMTDRPVLGICYGMQFVNAMAGGTLDADVTRQKSGSVIHSAERGGTAHLVRIKSSSHLHHILGRSHLLVNSYHIQAVAEIGVGLLAVGHSPDGVIEAVESLDGRTLGVQFHPERMLDRTLPLFAEFITRCRQR